MELCFCNHFIWLLSPCRCSYLIILGLCYTWKHITRPDYDDVSGTNFFPPDLADCGRAASSHGPLGTVEEFSPHSYDSALRCLLISMCCNMVCPVPMKTNPQLLTEAEYVTLDQVTCLNSVLIHGIRYTP